MNITGRGRQRLGDAAICRGAADHQLMAAHALTAFGRNRSCQHLHPDFQPPEPETTQFCHVWYLVMAGLANEYRVRTLVQNLTVDRTCLLAPFLCSGILRARIDLEKRSPLSTPLSIPPRVLSAQNTTISSQGWGMGGCCLALPLSPCPSPDHLPLAQVQPKCLSPLEPLPCCL